MPPANRTEKRKQQTRDHIIRIAVELFQHQGFQATTMDQIATEADIARKTLYNHFSVKEAIADAYVRDQSMALAKANRQILDRHPDTASRLLAALDKAYAWVETNPELARICLGYRMKNMWHGDGSENEETGTQGLMAEILRRGQKAGEIRTDIPIKLLLLQIDVLRGSIVMDWLRDRESFKLRREIARTVDLFLYGATGKKR
ncbi:Transcriptional regulator, TetR family [Desulfosarcina cetonica]|uniref:TetR/AcrR family transcriptional regulator n=1 Tax=Desulfosarcina cetonica TaxID=90730 RepID=UPI0006D09D11|nr:TetR/AcrR family transcriptional regulator [Desulfosarcina cetonica]VTR69422.1 Transcriptional regulator, TetR family [Desulfosarcina cetonica]